MVVEVEKKHPEVAKVVVEGGYDGADTLQGREDGDYEPWVASWQVTVWEKDTYELALWRRNIEEKK